MAEIPVVRKKGNKFPLWLIPLLLLLLLLPVLYFCNKSNLTDNTNVNANRANIGTATAGNRVGSANSGNTVIVVNNNDTALNDAGNGARDGSVIKDVDEFGSASDKSALVGRGFFVNDVRVRRVFSDKVFTVKSGSSEMFVMLDDNLDSGGGREKQIRMRRGQRVNLGGEFRNVPTGEVGEENREGGLSKREYAKMKGQQIYLHANSVSDAR